MPRNKITTDAGSVDVQWSKDGSLVCLVVNEEMFQFTDRDDLTQVIASLRRAKRQAFPELTGGLDVESVMDGRSITSAIDTQIARNLR